MVENAIRVCPEEILTDRSSLPHREDLGPSHPTADGDRSWSAA